MSRRCANAAYGFVALWLVLSGAEAAAATTWVVCPAAARTADCAFRGDEGIPQAISQASSGDSISIRAGRYAPSSVRDIRYQDITVRAYALIDGKDLSLIGEPGAVLDGSMGLAATAIAVRRATVIIRGLTITGFRYDVEEDDFYDGHGIFVIDATVRIADVTIRQFQKMGLTGRGSSLLDVSGLQILDGHVGIWLHETAYLRLRDAVIRGNDTSAVAAYDASVAHLADCALDGNTRDGLHAEGNSALYATNTLILRNRRMGAQALGASRIWLDHSVMHGNAKSFGTTEGGQVRFGDAVSETDPLLDQQYRPRDGSPARIGPHSAGPGGAS